MDIGERRLPGSTAAPAAGTGRARRSRAERDRLVEQYLPLVAHIVGRVSASLPAGVERDDLHGAGVMGLLNAAASYDATRGATFKTYAYRVVRGAVLDELRRHDPVTRSARERIRRLERAWRELASELGRSPAREELGERIGCTVGEVDESFVAMHTAHVLSLEDPGEGQRGIGDCLVAPGARQPCEAAQAKEAVDVLARAIAELPEQSRQVVVLYYHEGLLLKEIGTILGVSESRVSQILSVSITRLRLALGGDTV